MVPSTACVPAVSDGVPSYSMQKALKGLSEQSSPSTLEHHGKKKNGERKVYVDGNEFSRGV